MKEYRPRLTEKEYNQLLDLIQDEYIKEYEKAEKCTTRNGWNKHMRKHYELKSLYLVIATAKEV